jgi:hypothetical protein
MLKNYKPLLYSTKHLSKNPFNLVNSRFGLKGWGRGGGVGVGGRVYYTSMALLLMRVVKNGNNFNICIS